MQQTSGFLECGSCLLHVTAYQLSAACHSLSVVCCMSQLISCLLHVTAYQLSAACHSLSVVCCMSQLISCLLHVTAYQLSAACHSLSAMPAAGALLTSLLFVGDTRTCECHVSADAHWGSTDTGHQHVRVSSWTRMTIVHETLAIAVWTVAHLPRCQLIPIPWPHP